MFHRLNFRSLSRQSTVSTVVAAVPSLVLATCCLATLAEDVHTGEPPVASSVDKSKIQSDKYLSPAWTSGAFEGDFQRDFYKAQLVIKLHAQKGGFDAGVARGVASVAVDDVNEHMQVRAAYDVDGTGEGHWYLGPKISVGWNSVPGSDGSSGWFENYVIDRSSRSPSELDEWLRNAHDAKSLGDSQHDESVYKHYLVKHNDWHQFWAVRQSYRDGGVTSLKPILKFWREHGMPNKKFNGVKINLETAGQHDRTFVIKDYLIPSSYSVAPRAHNDR